MGANKKKTPGIAAITTMARAAISRAIENASTLRTQVMERLLDPRRDINEECGYPETITPQQYRYLYDREGVAKRVVAVVPEESWALLPEVYETEDGETETPFEVAWGTLVDEMNLFHHLYKVDEISGIGRFGILLLGIKDGSTDLSTPIAGVSLDGKSPVAAPAPSAAGGGDGGVGEGDVTRLLYLRAFDESVIQIDQRETNTQSPRYGKPTLYKVTFTDHEGANAGGASGSGGGLGVKHTVHWTRVIHVADNCMTSEVYGTPRMQVVFNRLMDLRKVYGGSAEMFWKGGFPGIAIEVNPNLPDAELDTDTIKEEMDLYMNGLQRWIALQGVTAKSLSPQVSDPTAHIDAQLENIAITLGVPKRVFFGSERGELASTQDQLSWNKRVAKRQETYLTPQVLRPLVDRLIAVGVLPAVEYHVEWPDLNTVTDLEKADVATKMVAALAAYIAGGCDAIVPPPEFLSIFLGMGTDEIKQIMDAAEEYQEVREETALGDAEIEAEQARIKGTDPETTMKLKAKNAPPARPAAR